MRFIVRFSTPLALLLTMLPSAGAATAAPAETERQIAIFPTLNNCNGELIPMEGTVHFVFKTQQNGASIVHMSVHAKGVGDFGNEYVLSTTQHTRTSASGEFSFDSRFPLISKGTEPNQHVRAHVDSDGNNSFEIECRG